MQMLLRCAAVAAALAPAAICHARIAPIAPAPFDYNRPTVVARGRELGQKYLAYVSGGEMHRPAPVDGTRGDPPTPFLVATICVKWAF
jgi:hypothetical protein